MKVATSYNNFARGKLDHDLNGRYDLPIYTSGADVIKNFISNFKGNLRYRCGWEKIVLSSDAHLVEFKYNNQQGYICVFLEKKVKFLSYDEDGIIGWVQHSGSDLEVVTPYTLAHAKQLCAGEHTQNGDVMYLFHNQYDVRKLTRVAADEFTITTQTRTADPFDDPASGTVGWPACGCFYKGYLYYGSPTIKQTNMYRSQGGSYDNLTTGTDDDDGLAFTIAEMTEPLRWLSPGFKSLIGGSSQFIVTINGGSDDEPITPTTVDATVTNTDGSDGSQPIRKDSMLFYINSLARRINYLSYNILNEAYEAEDANTTSYDITSGGISRLVFIKDRNDLIFALRADGAVVSLNFNLKEKIVGWQEHDTDGTVLDICRMTNNNGVPELFLLVQRGSKVFIERMAAEVEFPLPHQYFTDNESEAEDKEAYWRIIAERLKDCIYLDCCESYSDLRDSTITFDGTDTVTSTESDFAAGDVGKKIVYKTATGAEKGTLLITDYVSATEVKVEVELTPSQNSYSSWYLTFGSISGLTDKAGLEVSMVGDGGYLGEAIVSAGGVLTIGRQVTVARCGFIYEGLVKTFNLGFSVQGINTQVTVKNIIKAWLRTVFSAGGEVGVTLYDMQPVQDFDPVGFYDLPPLPMDGTKDVSLGDSADTEKCIYIRQNQPLPFNLTALILAADYGTRT